MGFSDFIKQRKREFVRFSNARDRNLQDVFLNVVSLENPVLAKQIKSGVKEIENAFEKVVGIKPKPKQPKQPTPPGYTPPVYVPPPKQEVFHPYIPIEYGGAKDKIQR